VNRILLAAALIAIGAGAALAQEEAPDVTVITSERLTYDSQEQFALFENEVEVRDPQMFLTSDTLTAHFDADNKVRRIEAQGSVYIRQEDRQAWGGSASYDVESGKMVLADNPRVKRGRDMLTGGTITFWRDKSQMVCEPGARLVIFPQEGGARDQLTGGR
jgi:lipopolysaccharide transport protein LptA